MFANQRGQGARRRGIVLVLILGMLGLLALIGVTFATFAGQSLINARNFNLSENRPEADQYMDFALAQIINDTNNPLSAIRGHGLLRDMYGNDSLHRGTTAGDIKGFLDRVLVPNGSPPPQYNQVALQFTAAQQYPNKNSPYYAMALRQYQTNIPTGSTSYLYYGLNFTRWVLRMAGGGVAQTFEVLEDDDTGAYHVFTLSQNLPQFQSTPGNPSVAYPQTADPLGQTTIFVGQTVATSIANGVTSYNGVQGTPIGLTPLSLVSGSNETFPYTFVLDGRFMRAFNGPGMTRTLVPQSNALNAIPTANPLAPFNVAAYGNFRTNGLLIDPVYMANVGTGTGKNALPTSTTVGDPDLFGADEDYDAADLENWFLAVQSADGQVVIPSFHRPGILTAADWTSTSGAAAVVGVSKILRPRAVDHSPTFPTDPSTPDPITGKLTYDVDNDGDGVTDSVWLDLGYPVQKDPGGKLFKPLFAFMIIGQNGRLPLNTVGNIQGRDYQTQKQYNNPPSSSPPTVTVNPLTVFDAPTWDHTSHLGVSANEVNPKYALQNAPANVYSNNATPTMGDSYFSQVDNAGVDVSLTQLRNILAGTVPQDNPTTPNNLIPQENNFVAVNGSAYYMPNGVIDAADNGYNVMTPGNSVVYRTGVTPVAGRWGEPEGIPTYLSVPVILQNTANNAAGGTISPLNILPNIYTNPVRGGRSFYSAALNYPSTANSFSATADGVDDDFDSVDPAFGAYSGEFSLPLDAAGQMAIATKRIQRYVTPFDPAGVGRLVDWMSRPSDLYDYGTGYDKYGNVGHFRYFRPPGVAEHIAFPIPNSLPASANNSPAAYLMPVVADATFVSATAKNLPNTTNNRYHGFEAHRSPITNTGGGAYVSPTEANKVAVFAPMPYDLFNGNAVQANPPAMYAGNTSTYGFTTPTESIAVNSASGPYFFSNTPAAGSIPPYFDQTYATVINGYPFGSLNKDEADEMNLYTPNHNDQQFGPTDLEWLYRKQDVDGATLDSRLSKLAPISFLNPKDGLTRRRLFSLESWDMNSFVYANDNPNGAFPYNSRFGQFASANLATLNQVLAAPSTTSITDPNHPDFFANQFATEALPNPTLPTPISTWTPNGTAGTLTLPYSLSAGLPETGGNATTYAVTSAPNSQLATSSYIPPHYDQFLKPVPGDSIATPTMTPSLAIRDRRINLNFPFPVASDPAEPVRQKWIRETYQLLKAILPPQAIDTPQELASLSQYVVNIVDFRDPDGTYTRFVNTDLMVTPAIPATGTMPAVPPGVQFATIACPTVTELTPIWDNSSPQTPHVFYPYDPMIAIEQTNANPTNPMPNGYGANWLAAMNGANPFLVQYGMEYNPVALNEVLCYSFQGQVGAANSTTSKQVDRFYVELVNTLLADSSHARSTLPTQKATMAAKGTPNSPLGSTGSSDLRLLGWDIVIMPDDVTGRPDPITGCMPQNIGGIASPAPPAVSTGVTPLDATSHTNMPIGTQTLPVTTGTMPYNPANSPAYSVGWTFGAPANGSLPAISGLVDNPAPTMTNPAHAAYLPAIQSRGVSGSGTAQAYYFDFCNITDQADQVPVDATPEANFPAGFMPNGGTSPATKTGQYYWLYLRRPANPFNTSQEMVVVDAIRFPWIADLTVPTTSADAQGHVTVTSTASMQMFSAQRQQPFRGGNPVPTSTTENPPLPASAYGFYDQTLGNAGLADIGAPIDAPTMAPNGPYPVSAVSTGTAPTGPNGGAGYWLTTKAGATGQPDTTVYNKVTKQIIETVGNSTVKGNNPEWDHIPFHDRDFTSVAELLLVPGCPPGLFTKQFIERPFSFSNPASSPFTSAQLIPALVISTNYAAPTTPSYPKWPTSAAIAYPPLPSPTNPTTLTNYPFYGVLAPTFPYLPDEFYYTGASVNPDPNGSSAPYPTQIGGMTGAGWYKMFDFFEVPSSANGAIGTASNGENFDWFRADRRPGAINLNLIYDEEVFFGLLDDPRLNMALAAYSYTVNNTNAVLPRVVSQINAAGGVAAFYPISDPGVLANTQLFPGTPQGVTTQNVGRGFTYADPSTSNQGASQQTITGMKAAFADFISLRHGGNAYIQAHQGEGGTFVDQMYHSLSYPDINYTVMRPGSPRPSSPTLTSYTWSKPSTASPASGGPASPLLSSTQPNMPTAGGLYWDPGVRFPWMDLTFSPVSGTASAYSVALSNYTSSTAPPTFYPMIPPIPPRRLFEIPDVTAAVGSVLSNASTQGDINNLNQAGSFQNPNLADLFSELVTLPTNTNTGTGSYINNTVISQPPGANPLNPSPLLSPTTLGMGGNYKLGSWFLNGNQQHPAYRTEMMQKVMNLSTVRTHQFAVWITVGFFEVTKAGTPELGVADILGGELNVAAGTDVRYRSFFTIDRTKATGYNPYFPSDFRDCVTYRHQIE